MKVMKIDTRIDLTKVDENFIMKQPTQDEHKAFADEMDGWSKKPAETRGGRPEMERKRMTATEFFKEICGQAIKQTHKSANIASLRRTNKIMSEFDDAINHPEVKQGMVNFEKDDFEYLRKAFRSADQWQNTPEIAKALLMVDERFESAEEHDI